MDTNISLVACNNWFQKIGHSGNKFYNHKKLLKNIHLSQKNRTKPFHTTKFFHTISNRLDTFTVYPLNKCIDRSVYNKATDNYCNNIEWFETYIQCAGYKRGNSIIKKYLSHLGKILVTRWEEDSIQIIFPIKYVEDDDCF